MSVIRYLRAPFRDLETLARSSTRAEPVTNYFCRQAADTIANFGDNVPEVERYTRFCRLFWEIPQQEFEACRKPSILQEVVNSNLTFVGEHTETRSLTSPSYPTLTSIVMTMTSKLGMSETSGSDSGQFGQTSSHEMDSMSMTLGLIESLISLKNTTQNHLLGIIRMKDGTLDRDILGTIGSGVMRMKGTLEAMMLDVTMSDRRPLELLGGVVLVWVLIYVVVTFLRLILPILWNANASIFRLISRVIVSTGRWLKHFLLEHTKFWWDYLRTEVETQPDLATPIVKAMDLIQTERGPLLPVLVNGKRILVAPSEHGATVMDVASLKGGIATVLSRLTRLEMAAPLPPQINTGGGLEANIPGNPMKKVPKLPMSVVRIVSNGEIVGIGSRLVVDGTDCLVTAKHVIIKLKGSDASLVNSNGSSVKMDKKWSVKAMGSTAGLVPADFIAIVVPLGVWAALAVPRSEARKPKLGEAIRVYGHDVLGEPCVAYGRVKPSGKLFVVLHDASTKQGHSGSPLWGNDGKQLAVHRGVADDVAGPLSNEAFSLDCIVPGLEAGGDTQTSPTNSEPEIFKKFYNPDDDTDWRKSKKERHRERLAENAAQNHGAVDGQLDDAGGTADPEWRRYSQGPRILTEKAILAYAQQGNQYSKRDFQPGEIGVELGLKAGTSWADVVDDEHEDDRVGRDESGLVATLDDEAAVETVANLIIEEQTVTPPPKVEPPAGFLPAKEEGALAGKSPLPKSMPTERQTSPTTNGSTPLPAPSAGNLATSGKPLLSRSKIQRLKQRARKLRKQELKSLASSNTSGPQGVPPPNTEASKPMQT